MKYLLSLLLILSSPAFAQTNRQLFDDFHRVYENSDFDRMDTLLADDFTLIQNGKAGSNKVDYMIYMMNWNKVFDTKWNVVSVQQTGQLIKSIEYDSDIFNDHFYDGKMKYQYTYAFDKNKIKSITVDTLPGTAQLKTTFNSRYGRFYKWVSATFPERVRYLEQADKATVLKQKELLEKYLHTLN
jgi:hypothetical protein